MRKKGSVYRSTYFSLQVWKGGHGRVMNIKTNRQVTGCEYDHLMQQIQKTFPRRAHVNTVTTLTIFPYKQVTPSLWCAVVCRVRLLSCIGMWRGFFSFCALLHDTLISRICIVKWQSKQIYHESKRIRKKLIVVYTKKYFGVWLERFRRISTRSALQYNRRPEQHSYRVPCYYYPKRY
jgi:hypothetical protein